MPVVPNIRLTPITAELAVALERGADAFESQVGARLGEHQSVVGEVVKQTLAMPGSSSDDRPFCGYLVDDVGTKTIIGTCAFTSRPAEDGSVEIAYFTFPPFERRGYASAMAARLVALAFDSALVRSVVAHTLPEPNASTRILEKLGFECLGEVLDPEDGRIWRWRLRCRS